MWVDKENRQDHRRMKQTVKFGGGNLMIWGCINWDGIKYATRIDGRMDANLYTEILGDELLKSLEYYNHKIKDVLKPLIPQNWPRSGPKIMISNPYMASTVPRPQSH